jgi:hypothetical protein
MNNSITTFNNVDNKVSPWEKPGGTLGMIVAGLAVGGGCILLYKILPFLISLTTNLLTLTLLVGVLAGIGFLVTNKRFRQTCSTVYFMIMRKITGFVIEIDPIAIVEKKVQEMKKKILDIDKHMGSINGLNKQNERKIDEKKKQLQNQIDLLNEYNKAGKRAEAGIAERQAVRLQGAIERQLKRLEDSKKWYEILKSLKHAAELTVLDTENEVNDRKEEFESIKAQHKAFSSIMSIMKGDPDQMEDFTRAMDFMAYDITQKLGEMSNVIDETGGILSQMAIEDGVASKRADELLRKYETNGIDGLFDAFNSSKMIEQKPEPIRLEVIRPSGTNYFDFKA